MALADQDFSVPAQAYQPHLDVNANVPAAPGYEYLPGWSTTGILFRDDADHPRFFNMHPDNHPSPYHLLPLLRIPDLTICSSSRGLVLCRDVFDLPDHIYYVFNPFIQLPISYVPIARPPRRHHVNTPAVLGVEISNHAVPRFYFYIICAICIRPGTYTFDAYFSHLGAPWRTWELISLQGRDIVPDSGVTCGKMAYWLTESPRSVIRFSFMANRDNCVSFLDLPDSDPLGARMQLGRVYGNCLGLVIVNEDSSDVQLHVLQEDDRFEMDVSKPVEIREDANWEVGDKFVFKTMPRPIRFESYNMEVLLWVDGRVVLWEANNGNLLFSRFRSFLPETSARIADGIPHVFSSLLPWSFVVNQLNM